jgi:hypothetical protein
MRCQRHRTGRVGAPTRVLSTSIAGPRARVWAVRHPVGLLMRAHPLRELGSLRAVFTRQQRFAPILRLPRRVSNRMRTDQLDARHRRRSIPRPAKAPFPARRRRTKKVSRRLVYRKKVRILKSVPGKKKTASPVSSPPKELWPGRRATTEDVTDFFRRVWKRYLPHGLTLVHIREFDPKLYNSIRNYSSVSGKAWPEDLVLPTERSRLSRAITRLHSEGANALSPKELLAVGRKLSRDSGPSP